MRRLMIAAVLVAASWSGSAAAAGKYPDVVDTSAVDSGKERVLQLSIDLAAPTSAVWAAFTDPGTVRRWSAPMAIIDLRQGGSMEESYSPTARPGDEENIRHEILAYVPGQLLVFRNTHAPSALPGRELYKKVVSILEVRDLGGGRSRLMLSQTGYGQGPEFDQLYGFFAEDNAELMEDLKTALETPKGKLRGAG